MSNTIKEENNITSNLIGLLIISTIITYYSGRYFGLQEFGFNILFPALFVIALINDKKTLSINNNEIMLFFSFLILTLVSVFYKNVDYDQIEFAVPKILATFMSAYIALGLNKTKDYEIYFHLGYIFTVIILIYFEYSIGNFNLNNFYKPVGSRNIFTYNANYYSYMCLFANFSMFRLHLKFENKITLISLAILPLLGLALSFTTQSRSGLIFIILINAVFWFWINKKKQKKGFKYLIRKIILSIIALIFSIKFIDFYNRSTIQTRIGGNNKEDAREFLVRKGIETFYEYPLTGVGPGNFVNHNKYRLFTHNTYVEALAEHGIFIGGLMVLVFLIPTIKAFKLFFKNKRNSEIKLNVFFFGFFLMYNNVYVFYKASFAMMYFFLMIAIQYKLIATSNKLNDK